MYTKTNIRLITTFTMWILSFHITAQNNPTRMVREFGDYMSAWSSTQDDSYMEKIEELTMGELGCRVNDGIMKIIVAQDTTGLLTEGTNEIDTYLIKLASRIERGLKYSHSTPEWEKNYHEPTAYNDKKDKPVTFVKMGIKSKGSIDYDGVGLFFVRNNQITKIIESTDSLYIAIRLYSDGKFDEAFKIFRTLAYAHPLNYDAQYYTAVMEILKRGCNNLSPKVRDLEAAWWCTRGVLASSMRNERECEQLAKLYLRFNIQENNLPWNTATEDFYYLALIRNKFMSEGLIPYKDKSNQYGFMDEAGRTIIPCQYTLVSPFNKNGIALAIKDRMVGYINKQGETVIPFKYKDGMQTFSNGTTYVLDENGQLFLIGEDGTVIATLGKNYDSIQSVHFDGNAYVHNKESGLWYVHDAKGNILHTAKEGFKTDIRNCTLFIEEEVEVENVVGNRATQRTNRPIKQKIRKRIKEVPVIW